MIFVPLPFVITLLLTIVLIQMLRRSEGDLTGNAAFIAFIGAQILQSILLGLRWGYDVRALMPAQVVLAALTAGLAWISFRGLMAEAPDPRTEGRSAGVPSAQARSAEIRSAEIRSVWRRTWPHLLPAAAVALLMALWRDPIDLAMIAIFLGYGLALAWLARRGPDVLVASRLDGALVSYRALVVIAAAMITSAAADVFISFDFAWNGGIHAGAVVAAINVLSLMVLGAAASVAGANAAPGTEPEEPAARAAAPAASEDDAPMAAALDTLMTSRRLYRDVELNLGRIARKLGVPARRVSTAVNRVHGMSVSQYVNNFRIREACRLLDDSAEPVTQVMFEAGFQSKSNFNREFLRVTGMSPTQWRQRAGGVVAASPEAGRSAA